MPSLCSPPIWLGPLLLLALSCGGLSDNAEQPALGAGGTSASSGGAGGSGGSGGQVSGSSFGLTNDEQATVAPLFKGPAGSELAGDELVRAAHDMALASGYALCRCAISPAAPPADLDVFHSCAEDESGEFFRSIHSDEALMCVSGHLSLLPFEDYLKCLYDGMRERGLYWLERCRAPETPYDDFTENTPSLSCEMDELVTLVLLECSMR